jgi:hypothetical protein
LEGNLGELGDSASLRPRFEREAVGAAGGGAMMSDAEVIEESVVAEPTEAMSEPEEEPAGVSSLASEGAEAAPADGDGADDTEGARLIALNMALNGTPREETDRYLAENFRLADRSGLLDEVYSSIEG